MADVVSLTAFRPNGVKQQDFTISPNGEIRTVAPPTQKFFEAWDSGAFDTINKWVVTNAGGGVAPAAATGQAVLNSGTTLNGYSRITTLRTFKPPAPGQLYADDRIGLPSSAAVGYQLWGSATTPATPTIAAPVTNAMAWEQTTAGLLVPVIWASGTRVPATFGAARGLPTLTSAYNPVVDTNSHNYFRYFEGRRGFWCIDDPDNVVAYYLYGNGGPDVNALPLTYLSISNGGASALQMQINGIDLGDTADTSGALLLDNGFTYDEMQSNRDTNTALINAVAATTTQTGADQINVNGRGVIVTLNMATVGTGSVTITIQGKDIASGQYYTLLAGAAVTTNSVNVYTVYPGAPATANVSANSPLPRTWRVLVTANNANATTYTVGASVIV